ASRAARSWTFTLFLFDQYTATSAKEGSRVPADNNCNARPGRGVYSVGTERSDARRPARVPVRLETRDRLPPFRRTIPALSSRNPRGFHANSLVARPSRAPRGRLL